MDTKGKLTNYCGIDLSDDLNDRIVKHIQKNIINVPNGTYKYHYMRGQKKITGSNVDKHIMIDVTKTFIELKGIQNVHRQHPDLYDHILIIYKNQTGDLWYNHNTYSKHGCGYIF
jgi:hypothetical protein